jgi:hypothetical protein
MARTKFKTELFGKHPLAKSIEPVIEKWSADNYPPIKGRQITHITRELMDYWFSDMAHEGEFFHPCKKRAIETIIYCYEILGIAHVEALFMPDNLRKDFDLRIFSKEDLQKITPFTESPFILITNWHQLMDTSRQKEITLSEYLVIESRDAAVSQRVERFMDFLTYNGDLMVINDEAHHVHNASDAEQKRWQESIEELREKIKQNKDALFSQLDFTATPFTIKGKKKEFFAHVVYDYGLVEAMHAMLVKQLFIEKSSLLSNKIESLPESEKLMVTAHRDESNKPVELSEVQKHMIDIGLAKLNALQNDFNKFKINKEPLINSYDLLFVVEHPKYNEIYTQLIEAGAAIASGNSIDLSLDTKVDKYVSDYLFGRKIDFSLDENVKSLRYQQVYDFVITEVRKKLMKFIQADKSNEVIKAEWTNLSDYKNLKIHMERAITTKKCLYTYVDFPPGGGFERKWIA